MALNATNFKNVKQPLLERLPVCSAEIYSLTRIKDRLPSYVEYNHIKAVIASLVAQLGQTTNPEGNLVLGCKPPENTLSAATIYKIDDDDDDNDVRAVPAPHSDPSRSPSPDLLGQGAGTVPAMLQVGSCCAVSQVCLFVGWLVCLRDGSAQTILRAATLRYKLQIKLSTSPSHSILTPGRPDPITPGAWQGSHWSANF